MTPADRPDFAKMLIVLASVFDCEIDTTRQEAYFSALSDLEWDDVRQAGAVLMRTARFFPKPAEFRETITGTDQGRAELAWTELQRQVSVVGYTGTPHLSAATDRAMRQTFGSWRRCCDVLQREGPGFAVQGRDFKAAYVAAYQRDSCRRRLGSAERQQVRGGVGDGND